MGRMMYANIRHMKRTTIYLEPELEVLLKLEVLRQKRPMAELVREALHAYVAREPSARAARRRGVLPAAMPIPPSAPRNCWPRPDLAASSRRRRRRARGTAATKRTRSRT